MTTNAHANPTFTTRAYVRSHGKQPRGHGSWAFQETTTEVAFDEDMVGEVRWFYGTLAEAKRQAKAAGMSGLVAVLP